MATTLTPPPTPTSDKGTTPPPPTPTSRKGTTPPPPTPTSRKGTTPPPTPANYVPHWKTTIDAIFGAGALNLFTFGRLANGPPSLEVQSMS
ncbi:hypothetical protein RB195_018752 [Necator americanus]|uniref:Uncharacterized protein n=1 Tax=Necator americanus TaxID=51031 RepID=A0ABR1CCR5_NECAM